MDLRVVKTEKVIREAFLSLRREKPLEKIKVHEICDLALINKSTFYKHYTDVFDLSDKLEDEFIEQLLNINSLNLLFKDPEMFVDSLLKSVFQSNDAGMILFKDRIPTLLKKVSNKIIEDYHESGHDEYASAVLFVMGGLASTHFLFKDQEDKHQEVLRNQIISYIKVIGDLINQMSDV